MNSYQGYGRFIIHRIDGEFDKYELMHSDIIQFGHTVPYRTQSYNKGIGKKLDPIKIGEAIQRDEKLTFLNEWLDEYVSNCMPYELENMVEGYDFEVELDGFAEICGFLKVIDTSCDTPYGYEYDSELHLEEPEFTPFRLEDLKECPYYNARTIAEWMVGSFDEEIIEEKYRELVAEGFQKTWEDLEKDEEAMQDEYQKMLQSQEVPLCNLQKKGVR